MRLEFIPACEENELINEIINKLGFDYIKKEQVKCVYSKNSSSRKVIARIWSTPRIITFAYKIKPLYVIELLKHKFKQLNKEDKIKVLIHELLHIPKTFSGALKPHIGRSKTLECELVEEYYNKYNNEV